MELIDGDAVAPVSVTRRRNQGEARRVVDREHPFRCCVVCGLQLETCLQVAHLDQDAANNAPDNLARLCPTHHWMHDAGLYPVEVIRLLRDHWQATKGVPNHKPRMNDAGIKAALARKRSAAAQKAVITRRANAGARAQPIAILPSRSSQA